MRARRLRSILRRLQTKQCLCLLVLVAGAILLTRPYGTRATAVDPALWKAHRQLSTPVAGDVRVVPWHAGAPPMSTPAANDLGHEHNAATARDARHPESADGANASLVEHVYTLAGSEINKRISYGNVLPYVSRPHAFSYWVPMTAAMNDNNKIEDPWYSASHRRIYGIRCSHQPSLWIGDWAFFLLSFVLKADFAQTGGYYDSAEAIWRPHLFWTAYKMTAACAAVVEVTSTMHGAMVRSIVPASCSNKPPVVRFFFGPGKHSKSLEVHPHEDEDGLIAVGGSTRKSGHGMTQPMDLFFYATISTEQDSKPSCIDDFTLEVSSKQKRFLVVSHSCASADSRGDWVQTVRVATSLISVEQAKLNYNRQLRSQTFRQVLQSSKDEWNLLLRRHQVVESGLNDAEEKEALQIVYTCLYRFLLFPSKLHEINSTGGIVHMSAYTEPHEVQLQHKCSTGFESIQIDPAPVLGNAAFLSTLRCVLVTIIRVTCWVSSDVHQEGLIMPAVDTILGHPIGRLVDPHALVPQGSFRRLRDAVSGDIIQGWLASFVEGGWLVSWSAPGYAKSMVSTMGDAALADAIVNREFIANFDEQLAYKAIRNDAFAEVVDRATGTPVKGNVGHGRPNLKEYLALGYFPADAKNMAKESVSVSLNCMLADYSIGQAASSLGYTSDAKELGRRSMQYFKLWSSRGTSKGFFVPRYAGSEPRNGVATVFNQFAWGGPEYKRKPGSPQAANSAAYSEGGAWQYRFYVPHDPDGLADLYQKAGLDLCDMILESQTMEAKVDAKNSAYNGGYGEPIHEMEEMKFRCWGQYECNNQNSFHVLWMLAAVHNGKCASKAQPLLHKVLTEAFVPGLRMFPGDEDNGSMSAFYLLSALGIYHLAPGSGKWLVTGAPLFNNVRLQVANGNVLSISKVNAKAGNCVARRLWNGQAVTTAALDFKQLATGGRLQFFMQKCTEVELKATREINKQKLAQRKQDHQNKMSKSAPNELLLKEERQLRQKVKTRLRNAVKLPPRVGTKRTKRLNTMREARVRIRSRST